MNGGSKSFDRDVEGAQAGLVRFTECSDGCIRKHEMDDVRKCAVRLSAHAVRMVKRLRAGSTRPKTLVPAGQVGKGVVDDSDADRIETGEGSTNEPSVEPTVDGGHRQTGEMVRANPLQAVIEGPRELGGEEKTSRTSSKPPATDRKERREQAKPSGAKPGHEGHSRVMSEDPDAIVAHRPDRCACCGGGLHGDLPAEVVSLSERIELPEVAPVVTQHQRLAVQCLTSGRA